MDIVLAGVWIYQTKLVLFISLTNESSSSSSDDSSDDELTIFLASRTNPDPKEKDYITIVADEYSDEEFRQNFRIRRGSYYQLLAQFEASEHYPKLRSHGGIRPNSAESHVLSFLWFAGNKGCLRDISGRFGIGKTSLHRQIERVLDFLVETAPQHIYIPRNVQAKTQASEQFRRISGFPGVLGCIDGTHIPIKTPVHKIKSTYVNRHDRVTLTLQGICDAKYAFVDVFTGTPGRMHDARVYRMSFIADELPAICNGENHLLGDSAYPLSEWLLTPYKDFGNLTEPQRSFNRKLSATRVRTENAFGKLKQRFRQLLELDFDSVDKATQFLMACCVLHNICVRDNDDGSDLSGDEEEIDDEPDGNGLFGDNAGIQAIRQLGAAKRDRLAAQLAR